MTKRLLISFSGGRTSAYMAYRLINEDWPLWDEIIVMFANTGQEHPATLDFVRECDRRWGLNVVWIEANPMRNVRDPMPTVVSHATASTHGEPFEKMIKVYGIPNKNYPHCTRELKTRPMRAYLHRIGWKSFWTAVGIRADEIDRMSVKAEKEQIIYPLVKWGVSKADVNEWWSHQPFNLSIPEELGNCTWCWKKSLKKHRWLAENHPEVFDFPRRMMATYPDAGHGDYDRPRRFFRGNLDVEQLTGLAPQDHEDWPNGGCSESCEVHEHWNDDETQPAEAPERREGSDDARD